LTFSPPRLPLPAPRRILLIKLRHHGDVLLATPVAHTLRRRFPDAKIDMLVYHETAPMLAGNPDLHTVYTLNRQLRGLTKRRAELSLGWQLYRQGYDWVIHLSDQWNGAVLARLCGQQQGIGFDYPKRRTAPWARLFTQLAPLAASNTCHTVEQNLLSLTPLGITAQGEERRCIMAIRPVDHASVRLLLASLGVQGEYLLVHPASRWFFKCWEDDRFAEVIQTLADAGHCLVLTCAPDPQEVALVEAILQRVKSPRVHSLAGKLSLNTLAAAIDGARLFLGVDSVPMHMAAALGKDTVALFGPSKVNEWRPWLTRYRLIHAADYGDLIDPDAVDTGTTERYLVNIPVAPVLAAVQALLALPPAAENDDAA